jgi:hypothetical protein
MTTPRILRYESRVVKGRTANSACEVEGRVSSNVVITRVEPDGRCSVEARNGNARLPAFFECMNEKMRAAR